MRAKLRRGGAIALLACTVLAVQTAFASSASARVLPILVMGDSYSAGNGAGDYFGAKGCWRSPNNYAGVFARALQAAPYNQPTVLANVACSGDTTHAFAHWAHGRRPQLDAVNKGYGIIFLTVGGDDIDFAGIVQNCLIQITRDGRRCNALLLAAEKDLRDGTLEGHIVDVLNGIRQRASSEAQIVLVGYPYIESQENYLLPYGNGKSIDVPKRVRALGDLGDQVQQRAVERLNAKYRTSAFVFVNTKALFAGHELDALSLNPSRWFVAPETDAGLAWRDWWYHPNATGWYEEAQLLLSDPRVPKYPVATSIRISRSGQIGALRLDVSTAADVEGAWGAPDYTTTGNVGGGPGYPNYTLLGYRCHARQGYTACAINFYVSQTTHRLESFATTSPDFLLFGGVHVGMSADVASRREHQPNELGCGQSIGVSTQRLSAEIGTRGGHAHPRNGAGEYVIGGQVASIGIDYKQYGVGVLFC